MNIRLGCACAALLLFLGACGNEEKAENGDQVVKGFTFEVVIEPRAFAPQGVEPVLVASTGDPNSNPPGTVQLYTPNDTLTWYSDERGDVFSFDVEVTNFYEAVLCDLKVVVDTVEPGEGRVFLDDDRGTPHAADLEGAGVWAYGDVEPGTEGGLVRRWQILLSDKESFSLKGRVLVDWEGCGGEAPPTVAPAVR